MTGRVGTLVYSPVPTSGHCGICTPHISGVYTTQPLHLIKTHNDKLHHELPMLCNVSSVSGDVFPLLTYCSTSNFSPYSYPYLPPPYTSFHLHKNHWTACVQRYVHACQIFQVFHIVFNCLCQLECLNIGLELNSCI